MYKIVFLVVLLSVPCWLPAQNIRVTTLQCEHLANPLGIDAERPVFSWQLESAGRGCRQTAYELQVAARRDDLDKATALVWSSGKNNSAVSIRVPYAGSPLHAAQTYYWRVRVWNQQHQVSAWSETACFTTGLYQASDWSHARWIGYEDLPDSMRVIPGLHYPAKQAGSKLARRAVVPLFRKDFRLRGNIRQALVFICGLGQYEMYINGNKAGDRFLAPGWTNYDKRCLYNTYDVTALLRSGSNTLGVMVGNGFYYINRERYFKLATAFGLPKLICKLQVTYTDGSADTLVSDTSWKTTASPLLFSSIYGGENYDARLEQDGWPTPGFNDAGWKQALLVQPPRGQLQAETGYPVKINERFTVKNKTRPADSVEVYDFGQNMSGIIQLKVKGKKGETIKLTPAELLTDQGFANQKATGKPYYFSYTLKGDGEETWQPFFTYYGFRYVQVETMPADSATPKSLQLLDLQALHTGNAAPATGSFSCDNPLFNRIYTLINRAIKSNVQSVVTDCPHREKLGWLEQDYLMGGAIHANMDIYHLYKKLVYDMMDAQTPEGLVPDIAPEYVFFDDKGFGFRDSPEWGSACVILPWLLYQWYNDETIVAEAYPMMVRYVCYLGTRAKNHLLDYGLGDWYDLGPNPPGVAQLTPKAVTASAMYYYNLVLLRQMAALLHKGKDARRLHAQASAVKKAFNQQFFNKQTGVYATGSQTAMAMPLCTGLVNRRYRQKVFTHLTDSITFHQLRLTAGDIGFHFLVQALHEGGADQLLYDMNNRDDVPGYGYQLKKGATTLTESWAALKEVSNNHLMLGHIMEWLYNGLGGIEQAAQGYSEIRIDPRPVKGLGQVKASYASPYGPVVSEWQKTDSAFSLHVQVPCNTRALVYLPAADRRFITESGKPLQQQKEIRFKGYKNGKTVLQLASGSYDFVVKKVARY
jgi:hypothetical protein